jgi:hypothetical protein
MLDKTRVPFDSLFDILIDTAATEHYIILQVFLHYILY